LEFGGEHRFASVRLIFVTGKPESSRLARSLPALTILPGEGRRRPAAQTPPPPLCQIGTYSICRVNLRRMSRKTNVFPRFCRSPFMFNNSVQNDSPECAVCCAAHDQEIHEATLRIHGWFRQHIMRNFVNSDEIATA
jgi:hypothetical protein